MGNRAEFNCRWRLYSEITKLKKDGKISFDKNRITGIACAIPKNIIRPDVFKEKFGYEEVEKFACRIINNKL